MNSLILFQICSSPMQTSTRVVWEMEFVKIKICHHTTAFQLCCFDWFSFSFNTILKHLLYVISIKTHNSFSSSRTLEWRNLIGLNQALWICFVLKIEKQKCFFKQKQSVKRNVVVSHRKETLVSDPLWQIFMGLLEQYD